MIKLLENLDINDISIDEISKLEKEKISIKETPINKTNQNLSYLFAILSILMSLYGFLENLEDIMYSTMILIIFVANEYFKIDFFTKWIKDENKQKISLYSILFILTMIISLSSVFGVWSKQSEKRDNIINNVKTVKIDSISTLNSIKIKELDSISRIIKDIKDSTKKSDYREYTIKIQQDINNNDKFIKEQKDLYLKQNYTKNKKQELLTYFVPFIALFIELLIIYTTYQYNTDIINKDLKIKQIEKEIIKINTDKINKNKETLNKAKENPIYNKYQKYKKAVNIITSDNEDEDIPINKGKLPIILTFMKEDEITDFYELMRAINIFTGTTHIKCVNKTQAFEKLEKYFTNLLA